MSDVAVIAAELVNDDIVVEGAQLTALSGGVSSDVWRVRPDDISPRLKANSPHGLIVKSPLARLRVPDVWESSITRGPAEAAALDYFATLTPDAVPVLVWHRDDLPAIAVESAPMDWEDWRDQLSARAALDELLSSARIARIAGELGQVVATWHVSSQDFAALPSVLNEGNRLQSLRTDPFHRAVAARIPTLRADLVELAEELESQQICLVHGDVSPKNVLVGPTTGMWVIDAEVAHVGNPALDVAFPSAHFLLKAVLRPDLRDRLDVSRQAFEVSYRATSRLVSSRTWSRQTGAILAARVQGVSQVGYLNDAQRSLVLEQAGLLIREHADLDQIWHTLRMNPVN